MQKPPPKPPGGGEPPAQDPESQRRVQQLIGKGKNISVRRVQMAGLSQRPPPTTKPGGFAQSMGQKLSEPRRWRKLPRVPDWSAYPVKPSDIVLLKELEAASPQVLRQRLAEADDEDLTSLVGLTERARGSDAPLIARVQEIIAERKAPTKAPPKPTPMAASNTRSVAKPMPMGDDASQTKSSVDALRKNLEEHLAPLASRGRELLALVTSEAEARIFCEGFVDAAVADDASGVMLSLVELGFAAGDYSHLLPVGRELGVLRADAAGLGMAEAFARGVGHVLAPLEASCAPSSVARAAAPRARQAFILGVVAAYEIAPPTRKRLSLHLTPVVELLRSALGAT